MENVLIKDFCENNNFTSIVNRSTWNKSLGKVVLHKFEINKFPMIYSKCVCYRECIIRFSEDGILRYLLPLV